jgi:hypothetical protein
MRLFAALFLSCLSLSCGVCMATPATHFLQGQFKCDNPSDSDWFANHACYLDAFDPGGVAGLQTPGYRRPTCSTTKSLTTNQKNTLRMAHATAPTHMKMKLCQLSLHDCTGTNKDSCFQLFLTDTSDSWGFWEAPDICGDAATPPCTGSPRSPAPPFGGGIFIAIPDAVLGLSLAQFENAELKSLAGLAAVPHLYTEGTASQTPTDPKYAVLAALAHEMGHLLLSDRNADEYFSMHPRRVPSHVDHGGPSIVCFRDSILGQSWDQARFEGHAKRWIAFNAYNGDQLTHYPNFWQDLLAALDDNAKITMITRLYGDHEFVSLWAALRPEEDFVEAYKYKVLYDAMNGQPITFGNMNMNVFDTLTQNTRGNTKLQCLGPGGGNLNLFVP